MTHIRSLIKVSRNTRPLETFFPVMVSDLLSPVTLRSEVCIANVCKWEGTLVLKTVIPKLANYWIFAKATTTIKHCSKQYFLMQTLKLSLWNSVFFNLTVLTLEVIYLSLMSSD